MLIGEQDMTDEDLQKYHAILSVPPHVKMDDFHDKAAGMLKQVDVGRKRRYVLESTT